MMNQVIPKDFLQAWGLLVEAVQLCDENRGQIATREDADFLIKALIAVHHQSHRLGLRQSVKQCDRLFDQLHNPASHRVLTRKRTKWISTMPKEVPLPDFESVYWQLQSIAMEFRDEMAHTRLAAVRPDVISDKATPKHELIPEPAGNPESKKPAIEREPANQVFGRLRSSDDSNEVWLDEVYYDLRKRKKAWLCIEYLVKNKAFNDESARHLNEIDTYVREKGRYREAESIRIDHYFGDQTGRLPKLRKELILAAAGRTGRYYLKID